MMHFMQQGTKWCSFGFGVSILVIFGLAACRAAPVAAPYDTRGNPAERVQATENAVTLNFALKAGEEDVACGGSYTGIGSDPVSIQIRDARLYISNVYLLNNQGKSVPLALTADGKWQNDGIALLDFENGSADCSEIGNVTSITKSRVRYLLANIKGLSWIWVFPSR